MAKFNKSLVALAPHASGEQNFVDAQMDNLAEPLNKSLVNNGKDGIIDGSKSVKVFPRKGNRFGNDMKDSIKNYDKKALKEVTKEVLDDLVTQADIKESAFDRLKNKIKRKEGYSDKAAAAVAAIAGRKKYGKEGMARKAAAGRKHHKESEQINEATTKELLDNWVKKNNIPITESEDYKVPKDQVHRIVDKFHVGAKDEEIKAEILRRVEKNKSFKWPDMLVARTLDAALKRHHGNQRLYKRVMSGDFHEEEIIQYYGAPIYEVMSPDATAADWIDDFVHSKNEKFKGKSKKERIKMALGAYYGHHKESELNEADPATLAAIFGGAAVAAHLTKSVIQGLKERKAKKAKEEAEKNKDCVKERFENRLPWVKDLEKDHALDVKRRKEIRHNKKIENIKAHILANKKSEDNIKEEILDETWKYVKYNTKEEAGTDNPCRLMTDNKLAYKGEFKGTKPKDNK